MFKFIFFAEKNLIKPEELKAMVSQKFFKDITPDSVEANELRGRIQILLLTANDYEYYAALAFLKPVEGDTLFRCQHQYTGSLAKVATYTFGRFGACNAAVQMMTFQGPAAAQEVITMAANFFGPNLDAIFSVGVACGVEKKNIKFLDVLVSKSVSFYKVARHGTTDDGKLKITSRDIANLPTSNLLLQHFSNPPEWPVETSKIAKSLTETPKLHKGLFLSGDYLVDNKDFKYELLNNFAKEAIGIEMEGAGLYHDYRSHSYQILIVKAVCDFGDGKKNKDYQPTAALLAVECLHHYLSREALPKNLYDHCNKKGKHSYLVIENLEFTYVAMCICKLTLGLDLLTYNGVKSLLLCGLSLQAIQMFSHPSHQVQIRPVCKSLINFICIHTCMYTCMYIRTAKCSYKVIRTSLLYISYKLRVTSMYEWSTTIPNYIDGSEQG